MKWTHVLIILDPAFYRRWREGWFVFAGVLDVGIQTMKWNLVHYWAYVRDSGTRFIFEGTNIAHYNQREG